MQKITLTLNAVSKKSAPQAWLGIFMPCHYRKATRVAGMGYGEISS